MVESRLIKIMKGIGALPVKPIPRDITPRRKELNKVLYRIGGLPYHAGEEYLLESINFGVLLGKV